jgi:hypothetical protein
MKMTTEIPSNITTPDSVETRLGTLKFFDGFPDDKKVMDNLDFSRGVQTFLSGLPGSSLVGMRTGLHQLGANNNTVVIFEELLDSKALWLTANTDSIYFSTWLDLHDGPLVMETPPNVLGFLDDFWFNYIADFGNVGPDKGKRKVSGAAAGLQRRSARGLFRLPLAYLWRVDGGSRIQGRWGPQAGRGIDQEKPAHLSAGAGDELAAHEIHQRLRHPEQYDSHQTRSELQSDQQFPTVGSEKEGIVTNPDTSADVYFGPTARAGHEANWVQTIPGKGWNVLLRLYGPLEPWYEKTWRPGEIELVK